MTAELRPLAVWGAPQPGDVETLQRAESALGLPFALALVPAVPGSPTRVLALRSAPPFLCDFRGSVDPQNDPDLLVKMMWVLDPRRHDPAASLILDQLRGIFGPDVTEIPFDPEFDVNDPYPTTRRHNPND